MGQKRAVMVPRGGHRPESVLSGSFATQRCLLPQLGRMTAIAAFLAKRPLARRPVIRRVNGDRLLSV